MPFLKLMMAISGSGHGMNTAACFTSIAPRKPFHISKSSTYLIRAAAIACMAWLVAMFGTGSAQEWVKLREEGKNFYDIQRSFEKAEAQSLQKGTMKKEGDREAFENEEEEGGYTQFKRWEYWMEPRAFASGDLPAPDQNFKYGGRPECDGGFQRHQNARAGFL
jgi:hypothetical protein